MNPKAYNVETCSQALGLTESKVRHLIDSGKLAHGKEGRRYIIPAWAIDDYLESVVPRSTDRRTA
jgi:excisionase family DNA binding protein